MKTPAPPHDVEAIRDTGTKTQRSGGWPSKAVGASREPMASCSLGSGECVGVDRREKLIGESWGDRTANRHRWARRVASGGRVRRGQGTRHNDPVTSEEGMPSSVTGTPERWGAAVNRPKRLFSKNTGACQAAQGAVYALTPARCRKVKGRGEPQGEALSRSPGKRRP